MSCPTRIPRRIDITTAAEQSYTQPSASVSPLANHQIEEATPKPLSTASPIASAVNDQMEEISAELAQLMQRTALLAQKTIHAMAQKARGSQEDVLESVRLLSRLHEQCREALATAELSLPSEAEEARSIQKLVTALRESGSVQDVLKTMEDLKGIEPSLPSSVGKSLRSLMETRLVVLKHAQQDHSSSCTDLIQTASELRAHHRAAGVALRTLTAYPRLSGAIERIGLGQVAQVIDSDIARAMTICQSHLDLIASQEEALVRGLVTHNEQIYQARRALTAYGKELERSQALQSGAQAALLEHAGSAIGSIAVAGIRALEQVHQEALQTQATLQKLAFRPIAAACQKALELKGAYGAIRGALLSLADRESLVHTLENWLIHVGSESCPTLFSQPLTLERWTPWSSSLQTVSLLENPSFMGWSFQALGLADPPIPQGLQTLQEVVDAYCVARELLQEMDPEYDPDGKIIDKIFEVLKKEQQKWLSWAELGLAEDVSPNVEKLVQLGTSAVPSPGLMESIQHWRTRQSSYAQAVAERLQRVILSDWRKRASIYGPEGLHAWMDPNQKIREANDELKYCEEILYSHSGGWNGQWANRHQRARDAVRLAEQFSQKYHPFLLTLNQWISAHYMNCERIIAERALDLKKLSSPFIKACSPRLDFVLVMPEKMEEVFTEWLGEEVLGYIRQLEILGLGHLKFISGLWFPGRGSDGWAPGQSVESYPEALRACESSFLMYTCSPLKWVWVDLNGTEHEFANFYWSQFKRLVARRASLTGFEMYYPGHFYVHPAELTRLSQEFLNGVVDPVAHDDYAYVHFTPPDCAKWGQNSDRSLYPEHSRRLLQRLISITGLSPSDLNRRHGEAQPADWNGEAHKAQSRMMAYLNALGPSKALGKAEDDLSEEAETSGSAGSSSSDVGEIKAPTPPFESRGFFRAFRPTDPIFLEEHQKRLLENAQTAQQQSPKEPKEYVISAVQEAVTQLHPSLEEVWQGLAQEASSWSILDPQEPIPIGRRSGKKGQEQKILSALPKFDMKAVLGILDQMEQQLLSLRTLLKLTSSPP